MVGGEKLLLTLINESSCNYIYIYLNEKICPSVSQILKHYQTSSKNKKNFTEIYTFFVILNLCRSISHSRFRLLKSLFYLEINNIATNNFLKG